MKIKAEIPVIVFLIFLTFYCARIVYTSRNSEIIIDYVAFFGGIFLAIEAAYRIIKSGKKVWRGQFSRFLRALIGTCIFAIHTMQFMR